TMPCYHWRQAIEYLAQFLQDVVITAGISTNIYSGTLIGQMSGDWSLWCILNLRNRRVDRGQ
ncbi:hypothetical protein, partial [Acinetobacter baumannii]|uniref:hypothetical protein n=1 Tax=Acinetobacter baumannii TaxID=470 RepID=UPI001C07E1F5